MPAGNILAHVIQSGKGGIGAQHQPTSPQACPVGRPRRLQQQHMIEPAEIERRGIAQHVVVDFDLRQFGGSALTADIDVPKGRSATGPRPGTTSMPKPDACTGTTMSLKRTAASTPWRRTGWRVTSAAISGCAIASRIEPVPRVARYSGRERPACRMNHTGVWAGCSPRQTARKEPVVTWWTLACPGGR